MRKLTLTTRGLRRTLVAGAVAVAFVLVATLVVLPFGLRGAFQRFTIDEIAEENRALWDENEALADVALRWSRQVFRVEQRCRRLAWALGGPPEQWQSPAQPPPERADDVAALVGWLESRSQRVLAYGGELTALQQQQRCPLANLPTAPPLDARQAVPVAHFGWRVSPFTEKEEAHHGVTIAAPPGEPVLAPGGGTVVFARRARERLTNEWTRLGLIVVVDHGCDVFTVLGHLGEVSVRRGQRVARGDVLGAVGESRWTRVPALYMEIRWPLAAGVAPVDPALVSLELPLEDLDARLTDPTGGLPEDYARLERIVRRR